MTAEEMFVKNVYTITGGPGRWDLIVGFGDHAGRPLIFEATKKLSDAFYESSREAFNRMETFEIKIKTLEHADEIGSAWIFKGVSGSRLVTGSYDISKSSGSMKFEDLPA